MIMFTSFLLFLSIYKWEFFTLVICSVLWSWQNINARKFIFHSFQSFGNFLQYFSVKIWTEIGWILNRQYLHIHHYNPFYSLMFFHFTVKLLIFIFNYVEIYTIEFRIFRSIRLRTGLVNNKLCFGYGATWNHWFM
jgi:hypothetical protein